MVSTNFALFQAKLPMSEIAATINEYRSRHLAELAEVLPVLLYFYFFLLTKYCLTYLPYASDLRWGPKHMFLHAVM